MIIKKKYTTVKKIISDGKRQIQPEQNSAQEIQREVIDEVQKKGHEVQIKEEALSEEQQKNQEQEESAVKEKKKKKSIDDLDLTIENIKFEQREERREGTRRRGYRRTQDRNIMSRAQKDAETIKEAAKKDGYEAGIKNAVNDIETFKSNFAEFFNYKEKVFGKVSDCIMDVAVEIAKKIINKTVETDKEYIIPMIKGVVEEINKTENKIVLKVMPKDVEIVKDKVMEIFKDNGFEATISVIPDKEIKDGGVIVETSNGIIDASIETQIKIIEQVFKKKEES